MDQTLQFPQTAHWNGHQSLGSSATHSLTPKRRTINGRVVLRSTFTSEQRQSNSERLVQFTSAGCHSLALLSMNINKLIIDCGGGGDGGDGNHHRTHL